MKKLSARRRRQRHLDIQVDIQARELCLEFSLMEVLVKASEILRPVFCTEFQCESCGQSGLAWGAHIKYYEQCFSNIDMSQTSRNVNF